MQIHVSGERVAPGVYRQVGGSRKLFLEDDACLPPSADGESARYERVESRETPRTTIRCSELPASARRFALAGMGARS